MRTGVKASLGLIHVILVAVNSLPTPLLDSALNQHMNNDDTSWWTDTELESTLDQQNTLESISKSWQQNEPDALKRVFLKNNSVTCNDGSRAGYYIRKFPTSKIWLIFLEGGWYCYDTASCASRWMNTRYLMSSKSWQEFHVASGIMSGDPEENPIFWKANIVYVPYCSSDVWTGTSAKTSGQDYAFMGSLILQEVIQALLPKGLMKARKFMLAGSSAGATGVLLNIDKVSDLLRNSGSKVKVRGLVDSGWFLDNEPYAASDCLDPRRCSPVAGLKKAVRMWNGDIPNRCRNAYKHEPWNCFFGYKLYPFVQTSLFVFQWLYDEAQLLAGNVFVPRTKAHGTYVQNMRQNIMNSLESVSAVFAPACVGHVVLTEKLWASYSIRNVTFGSALRCWWDGTQETNRYLPSSSLNMPLVSSDEKQIFGEIADPKCGVNQLRRCRRRLKRQRKNQTSVSAHKINGQKKRCRCRRSRNNAQEQQAGKQHGKRNAVRIRRSFLNVHTQHRWTSHSDFCSHHLIEQCKLPNCNEQCPRNYDNFSGKPIDFEQMLRNAGVKSRNPIQEIFS